MEDFRHYPFLYRFRPNGEHTLDELSDSYVFFQSRLGLNDPLDCYPGLIKLRTDTESIKEYMVHVLGIKYPDWTRQQRRLEVRKNLVQDRQKWISLIEKAMLEQINKVGVACFTRQPSNLMMWSHYSSHHKGVCLQYNIEKDNIFFQGINDVNYTLDYKIQEYSAKDIRNSSDLFLHLFFTKSKVWDNEQEVRIIEPRFVGKKTIQRESLTGIFFGMECETSYRDRIIEITYGKYQNLKYYTVRPSEDSFGILAKELLVS